MKANLANTQIADPPTTRLRVIETDPHSDPRWTEFVLSHPGGSVYHHPAWLKALSVEYGQKDLHLACESDKGEFLAVMPLMYTRGLPFSIGGPFTGQRLSSLPRTPVAGPLSADRTATIAIIEAALQRVRQQPRMQLQIKTQGPELSGLVDGVFCSPWRNSYILALPSDSEGQFRISDANVRAKVRWAVNKSAKHGVVVRPAETESELGDWYRLYLETMRRNAIPPRTYRFFLALWKHLKPQGMLRLLIAERPTGTGTTIIAGSIFFMFGRTVSYAFNASRRGDLALQPNDVIQWRAINDACANHYRCFDFGESPELHCNLARSKMKWGASPVRMYRYYSQEAGESHPASEYGSHAVSLAQTVWRHLPIRVTEFVGSQIYSYL